MTPIRTLSEYIDTVHQLLVAWNQDSSITHPWLRGQARESWDLDPSIYRPTANTAQEREMLRDFKLRYNAFQNDAPSNDMELFFVMQHYGMPTRLLDWTESHLVALFFAVESQEVDFDAAVWILGPATLNGVSNSAVGRRVPMSDHDEFRMYTIDVDATSLERQVEARYPMAVRPKRSTARIVAQRGMFTIHGHEQKGINLYPTQDEFATLGLHKLVISGVSKPRLRKELFLAGVSYASLFPDLDGLCREITYRYSKPYLETELPRAN